MAAVAELAGAGTSLLAAPLFFAAQLWPWNPVLAAGIWTAYGIGTFVPQLQPHLSAMAKSPFYGNSAEPDDQHTVSSQSTATTVSTLTEEVTRIIDSSTFDPTTSSSRIGKPVAKSTVDATKIDRAAITTRRPQIRTYASDTHPIISLTSTPRKKNIPPKAASVLESSSSTPDTASHLVDSNSDTIRESASSSSDTTRKSSRSISDSTRKSSDSSLSSARPSSSSAPSSKSSESTQQFTRESLSSMSNNMRKPSDSTRASSPTPEASSEQAEPADSDMPISKRIYPFLFTLFLVSSISYGFYQACWFLTNLNIVQRTWDGVIGGYERTSYLLSDRNLSRHLPGMAIKSGLWIGHKIFQYRNPRRTSTKISFAMCRLTFLIIVVYLFFYAMSWLVSVTSAKEITRSAVGAIGVASVAGLAAILDQIKHLTAYFAPIEYCTNASFKNEIFADGTYLPLCFIPSRMVPLCQKIEAVIMDIRSIPMHFSAISLSKLRSCASAAFQTHLDAQGGYIPSQYNGITAPLCSNIEYLVMNYRAARSSMAPGVSAFIRFMQPLHLFFNCAPLISMPRGPRCPAWMDRVNRVLFVVVFYTLFALNSVAIWEWPALEPSVSMPLRLQRVALWLCFMALPVAGLAGFPLLTRGYGFDEFYTVIAVAVIFSLRRSYYVTMWKELLGKMGIGPTNGSWETETVV